MVFGLARYHSAFDIPVYFRPFRHAINHHTTAVTTAMQFPRLNRHKLIRCAISKIVEVNTTPITKRKDCRVRCAYHSSPARSSTCPHAPPCADIRYAQRTLQFTLDL